MHKNVLGGIVIIGGVLYFTSAGDWLWERIKGLDSVCYSVMPGVNPSLTSPLCGGLASAVTTLDQLAQDFSGTIDRWYDDYMVGDGNYKSLDEFTRGLRARMDSLSSPREKLYKMMNDGPYSSSVDTNNQAASLQEAIDAYTIGQSYLSTRTTAELSMRWLELGARQDNGYGLMSQITLGNAYASGNKGIAADPQKALAYLQQAQESLRVLTTTNTPQAQQLLRSLPSSPAQINQQINQTMMQLRSGK